MSTTRYGILTGAAGGLGRALALRLADDGWQLALADRDTDGTAVTLEQMRTRGGDGRVEALDVTDAAAWTDLSTRLRAEWPRLDLLINNAGVAAAGYVGDMPIEDWRWAMEINFLGYVQGVTTFVDWLQANPCGASILNICSTAAFMSPPTMGAYSASKAAVLSFSETLYTELYGTDVSVTVMLPFFFKTALLERGRYSGHAEQEAAEQALRRSTTTAEGVARQAVRAMYRKRLYAATPLREGKLGWWVKRRIPLALLNHIARESRRQINRLQD